MSSGYAFGTRCIVVHNVPFRHMVPLRQPVVHPMSSWHHQQLLRQQLVFIMPLRPLLCIGVELMHRVCSWRKDGITAIADMLRVWGVRHSARGSIQEALRGLPAWLLLRQLWVVLMHCMPGRAVSGHDFEDIVQAVSFGVMVFIW